MYSYRTGCTDRPARKPPYHRAATIPKERLSHSHGSVHMSRLDIARLGGRADSSLHQLNGKPPLEAGMTTYPPPGYSSVKRHPRVATAVRQANCHPDSNLAPLNHQATPATVSGFLFVDQPCAYNASAPDRQTAIYRIVRVTSSALMGVRATMPTTPQGATTLRP